MCIRDRYAAVKFLLFSLAGGLIMLAAVIALYVQGPGGADGFLLSKLAGIQLSADTEKWIFVGFFIAFAVKAPMVPVHTWLPDAAAETRPATATLLVGVLDKVGTYGMIRFCLLGPGISRTRWFAIGAHQSTARCWSSRCAANSAVRWDTLGSQGDPQPTTWARGELRANVPVLPRAYAN